MTAEIALLNKLAVTLAADSAVTIGGGAGTKIYNSADKIFEGTNYDPIGIMVYNSPELSGVPVESIVKMFRDRVCVSHYATVFDFSEAFLKHLEEIETPDVTINSNIRSLIAAKLIGLRGAIQAITDEFFRTLSSAENPTVEGALEALEESIISYLDSELGRVSSLPAREWSDGITKDDVIEAHGDSISEFIDAVFEDDPPSVERKVRLVDILSWSLLREFQKSELTGLVFAGFGQNEIFPSLAAYEIYGTIAGRLKFVETAHFDVDRKLVPDAVVIPFAQKEMVDRFMYGLDSEFLEVCHTYFSGALGKLKDNLDELLAGDETGVSDAVHPAVDAILGEFQSEVVPGHLNRLQKEFSDMVRSMPKQELAALSESLVHITSLKRKFSTAAESVGGPIDVAMITRAEGFVWVKRKHYFDPALNPRYFFRHYGHGIEKRPVGIPDADAITGSEAHGA
ncbi:hypothetical protein P6144_03580 [Sphingomonas sp. HITSZ_GF]|uniref:hypothetical protein n=1 Tax=Sphingomonas sp. HITSZ_GF TaxID=3037247 RepID=UPI00240E7640|nr:hypothetical protein [Sphingomonas sp. HITSZ_GF]MDG2532715.1 hypothetical protein [Sphingomonas sp. HITSZ_GF]